MSAAISAIPFEAQSEELSGRTCGAACLSMVYRSLGITVPQSEIWPAIARKNRFGQISSTTHLMAQDALNRGFRAIAFQARHPLHVLRLCRAAGIRAILNHRVRSDSAAGHYSVLLDIEPHEVVVHDPLFGAARRLSHLGLMELWMPGMANSEIAGGVLIAIGAPAASMPAAQAPALCEFCHTPMPAAVRCPQCAKPIGLEPPVVLGCVNEKCIARMWNWICCPACDFVFASVPEGAHSADAVPGASTAATALPVRGVDPSKLLAAIEQFTGHLLSIPAAANHPDVQKQLAIVEDAKQRFRAGYAKEVARHKTTLEQLAALVAKTGEQRRAQEKKLADLNAPAPDLDGDALTRDLFRNLGFTN